MDTFLAGDSVWPAQWTKLHVYFVPDPEEIWDVVEAYRPVIEGFDFLAPVPDRWLHATVQAIGDRPASEVTTGQLRRLREGLARRVAAVPEFRVTAGGALAGRRGVVLDLTPDRGFAQLVSGCREVMGEVVGQASVAESDSVESGGRPHIALGYACGRGDSGVVQSRLRNATDLRASLTVSEVWLVDVVQDPVRHEFQWQPVERLPLGVGQLG